MSVTISTPVDGATETGGADHPGGRVTSPIFLVGAERSGTTLLRLIFDHHPKLAFMSDLFQFSADLMGPEENTRPDLDALEHHWAYRPLLESGLVIDRNLSYPDLIESLLRQKRDRDGKSAVGAVVHYHFDRLLKIWPDARFIHLIRDGRAVGLSSIRMGWAGNMFTAVSRWIDAERLWVELSRVVPADRRLDVRYEDFVADTAGNLARICEFLGLPYDPAMLSYSEKSTYGPPSTKAVDKWRTALSKAEVALAESRIGGMLVERGYELTGPAPAEYPSTIPTRLWLDDKWGRLKFRRKRYGTPLMLADVISRRLPIPPLRKAIRERVEKIDLAHLQ